MDERRIWTRKLLHAEGEIADPLGLHWSPIKIIDFSLGGLGFLCAEAPGKDTLRMLRIPLPLDGTPILRINLRVTNCVPHSLFNGYRVGGEFFRPDATSIDLIHRMMLA